MFVGDERAVPKTSDRTKGFEISDLRFEISKLRGRRKPRQHPAVPILPRIIDSGDVMYDILS